MELCFSGSEFPIFFRYLHLGSLDLYILPRAVSEIEVTTSLQSEYDAAFFQISLDIHDTQTHQCVAE